MRRGGGYRPCRAASRSTDRRDDRATRKADLAAPFAERREVLAVLAPANAGRQAESIGNLESTLREQGDAFGLNALTLESALADITLESAIRAGARIKAATVVG